MAGLVVGIFLIFLAVAILGMLGFSLLTLAVGKLLLVGLLGLFCVWIFWSLASRA